MQQRRILQDGELRIDNRCQCLVGNLDPAQCVFSQIPAFGKNGDDGLTDIAHLAARQRIDRRRVVIPHTGGRAYRLDQALQVFCRVDTADSRHLRGRSDVDARDYGMSMNAALESNVQSVCDSTVVGEHALSRQQAPVFDTLDPCPYIPRPQSNVGNLSHGTFR
jgi:hypothetical protein